MSTNHLQTYPTHYLSPKLTLQPNPDKGTAGVFAQERINTGELLMVWGGNILTGAQLETAPEPLVRFSVQVEEDLYLTTVTPPESADFVNHSCDPNAGLSSSISLVALRPIAPGEEICYDYAMSDGSPYDEFNCACGSPLCRQQVTGNDWQRPELQARYEGHFSPYLQRRIERLQAFLLANGHYAAQITTAAH